MAGYAGPISLSRDLSHSSGEEEDLTPRRVRMISVNNRAAAAADGIGTGIMSPAAEITPAARKPRGRPPGSKNKPKQPVVIAGESDAAAMKTAVLEISPGADVIGAVVEFARRNNLGVSVISGSGSVSNVTLRPPNSHAPPLTLHGPCTLVSLTGSVLPTSPSWSFGVSLAGQQGQVFGGTVAGNITAVGTVLVVVATFKTPSFHRLPGEFEEADMDQLPKARNGGGGDGSEGCSGGGMSMSSYGVASPTPLNYSGPPQIMTWGPTTTRPPKPY